MIALVLRAIGSNDYVVLDDGYPIGRIRLGAELHGEVWYWNVTIPVPGCGHGSGASLEEAISAIKGSWIKLKAELGPKRLAAALEIAETTRERLGGTKPA